MTLTPSETALIAATWQTLGEDPDATAAAFYGELFRRSPEVKPLFAGTDPVAQGRKLTTAIGLVVRHADDLSRIAPALAEMGRRHAGYGVRASHYDAVGAAFLGTLEIALDPVIARSAIPVWTKAYTAVATAMQAGAATTTPIAAE